MNFGDRLKELRLKKGLTQEQLANQIGVAKSTLTGYEKGNREPDVFKIKKILEILDADSDYLLGVSRIASDDTKNKHQLLIEAYDAHPEVQHSVDLLLGLTEHQDKKVIDDIKDDSSTTVWAAARSNYGKEPGYRKLDKETLERLLNAEPDNDKIP